LLFSTQIRHCHDVADVKQKWRALPQQWQPEDF